MVKYAFEFIYIFLTLSLKFQRGTDGRKWCYTWKKKFYFIGKVLEVKVYLNMEGSDLLVWVAGSSRKGKSNFLQELVLELRKGIFVVMIEPAKNRPTVASVLRKD